MIGGGGGAGDRGGRSSLSPRRLSTSAGAARRLSAASAASGAEAAAVAELLRAVDELDGIRRDWEALSEAVPSGKDPSSRSLLQREAALRESLRSCPLGDPGDATTTWRHFCDDEVVLAHGMATEALIRAELARLDWEARSATDADAGRLVDMAVLRMRLFDIEGGHLHLLEAYRAGSSDPRLDVLLRYAARLQAPRRPDLLGDEGLVSGAHAAAMLRHLRSMFLSSGYIVQTILAATKARSMSDLIFVDSQADQLESSLLASIEEPNPMLPDESREPRISTDLVDLVRVFLLHRILPLARLCAILGSDCVQLLLRLGIVCALDGDSCRSLGSEAAAAIVGNDGASAGGYLGIAAVAIWPMEEDLLIATDFEQTFSTEDLEPVMYLSEDSLALAAAAPRREVASVFDPCCGSGVQGIVALRYYAGEATFVDLNPRALRFTRFNLALNGLAHKARGLHLGSVYDALPPDAGPFDAIVANPPFVPNPSGIAAGGGALFGNGGDTGERVVSEIVQGASKFLRTGGTLAVVAMSPNVEGLPGRLEGWFTAGAGSSTAGCTAVVFRGEATSVSSYLPTSSAVETARYQDALRRMGIQTVSETIAILATDGPDGVGPRATLAGAPRAGLWADHAFLRTAARGAVGAEEVRGGAMAPPPPPVQQAGSVSLRAEAAPVPLEASDYLREGCLPGFQAGFFPGYCMGPAAGWERTAEELKGFAKAFAQRRDLAAKRPKR